MTYLACTYILAVKLIEQQRGHGIYQWTFHNSVIAAFLGWEDCRNDRTKAVCFGNNEPMDPAILDSIAEFMDANKVSYQWKQGDIFALNNRYVNGVPTYHILCIAVL